MNSKLKITLMRLILMHRSPEKGFALPIAMGVGLVIVLLGAVMMARSQTDRVTASTQKATTQGLSAAETGVARYQDLINKYRAIATYNNTGTISWTNASSIPNISSCGSTTEASTVSAQATANWQDLGGSDNGQYRLISYTYTPNSGVAANTAPGTGTLIVEGRVNQTGSGSTATQDVRTATSRIQVTIPISQSSSSLAETGLWATDFNFSGNNARANANVLDSSCSGVGTAFNTNPYLGDLPAATYGANVKGAYTKEVVAFPTLPGGNTYSAPTTGNINTISCGTNPMNLSGNNTLTLPRTNDKDSTNKLYGASTNAPASNATYTYVIPSSCGTNSISLTGNARITLGRTGQETIKIYASGNVEAAGNGGIGPYVSGSLTTKAILYVNGSINLAGNGSAFSPSYFQFYKYGTTGDVKLNGNGSSSAFIFAPFVETQLVGNATVSGVVWTKKISANGNASINQGKVDTTALEITAPAATNNAVGAVSSWQRNSSN
jgi:Tfp pilus assembly protein PilX